MFSVCRGGYERPQMRCSADNGVDDRRTEAMAKPFARQVKKLVRITNGDTATSGDTSRHALQLLPTIIGPSFRWSGSIEPFLVIILNQFKLNLDDGDRLGLVKRGYDTRWMATKMAGKSCERRSLSCCLRGQWPTAG